MKKFKTIIKESVDKLILWIKQHPTVLQWGTAATILCIVQSYIIGICFVPIDMVSMEAVEQVLATSAEVVAGLYGLTLTGYIFFQDQLQQMADKDELLEDIISLLKKRYHKMVLILSTICFVVIVSAFIFIIYMQESALLPIWAYHFWGFETLFLVFITLLFNIYFIITVVDPDKIPRVSLQYKQKLSNSGTELGSLQEFLQDYEEIEQLLIKKSEGMALAHLGKNPWKAIKQMNAKEKLEIRKIISDPLLKKLTLVSQYYNYMIFSHEMTVTKEMCVLAREVKNELEER